MGKRGYAADDAYLQAAQQVFNSGGELSVRQAWVDAGEPGPNEKSGLAAVRRHLRTLGAASAAAVVAAVTAAPDAAAPAARRPQKYKVPKPTSAKPPAVVLQKTHRTTAASPTNGCWRCSRRAVY